MPFIPTLCYNLHTSLIDPPSSTSSRTQSTGEDAAGSGGGGSHRRRAAAHNEDGSNIQASFTPQQASRVNKWEPVLVLASSFINFFFAQSKPCVFTLRLAICSFIPLEYCNAGAFTRPWMSRRRQINIQLRSNISRLEELIYIYIYIHTYIHTQKRASPYRHRRRKRIRHLIY